MRRSKEAGIDAFALNIGTDSYTDTQLSFAYESAANNGMHVFLSFDFCSWNVGQGGAGCTKVKQYADHSPQLKLGGKVFVSSFSGDSAVVNAIQSTAGQDIFFAPNFHPGQGNFDEIQGALNWMAWPNNGNNKAPTPGQNVSVVEGDEAYNNALKGKPYVARELTWN